MTIADRFPRLRRLSPLILLLAAVVLYFDFIAPHAEQDHAVTLQLQGRRAHITRVDTVWTGIDVREGEAVGGATFHFDPRQAPANVSTKVHGPSGTYLLTVTIESREGKTQVRRRVTLGAGDTTVFVRLPWK